MTNVTHPEDARTESAFPEDAQPEAAFCENGQAEASPESASFAEPDFPETDCTALVRLDYGKHYSEPKLWDKLARTGKRMGAKLLYFALLLWYVLARREVPLAVKSVVIAALGYLILPFDFVPDLLPGAGWVDDLAFLGGALSLAWMYVNNDVRNAARARLTQIVGIETLEDLDRFEMEVRGRR